MRHKPTPKALTYAKAILATFFWAITFIWVKIALEVYRPYEIVILRLALAAGLLFTIMLLTGKWEKPAPKDMLRMMFVAFCEPFIYFIGETNGLMYVSSTLGSLVISTIPLVTALMAWLLLKENISGWLFAGLLVSFAGVVIMAMSSTDLSGTLKGMMYLSLAVIGGTFYGITIKPLTHRYNALTIVGWQNLWGFIYFIPVFLFNDAAHFFSMQHQLKPLLAIVSMSLCGSVGAFMLYTGVIREMGVIKSNLFTNLIPVYTVVLAYFILGDKLNLRSALGLLITLVGIVVSQIPDIRKLRRGS